MTEKEREDVQRWLESKGYDVDQDMWHVVAEKSGFRLTLMLGRGGRLDAVMEEVADTSTMVRLGSDPERSVSLSWCLEGESLMFMRRDAVSQTVLTVL